MAKHLQHEIESLKKRILGLGAMTEEALDKAAHAVADRDTGLAQKVIAEDRAIDMTEVDVEEECLKILALHQPVAVDLRYIVAVLKINNDLERIGDLAVNIAERAQELSTHTLPPEAQPLPEMVEAVGQMLRTSLDSLVKLDVELAANVLASDDRVDTMNRATFERILEAMRARPEDLGSLLQVLSVSRYLERIADHATNIAEDVVYMIEGEIVRHGTSRPAT